MNLIALVVLAVGGVLVLLGIVLITRRMKWLGIGLLVLGIFLTSLPFLASFLTSR